MPKLLFITERFAPDIGGVARSASRTAHAIGKLGIETHVLAWTKLLPPGQLETVEIGKNVVLHRLGLFANWDLSMQHTINVLEWLHAEKQFDAVWGHYLNPAGFVAVLFAESQGIPSTVSARGNDVDRAMFPPGDFARLTWTLERATSVSAVSADLASKIRVLVGSNTKASNTKASDTNVSVIHNSVDVDEFCYALPNAQLKSELGIGPPEAVIGFCGELRHKKGLPFILSALAEVRRSRPACLLVIGEVRPREQVQLTNYLAENPACDGRVIVTGHLESTAEIVERLRLCDVFLQPSVWDGLPNAVLEAMACELVVIGSDAGGIPEAIEHERSGFVIPRSQLHRLGEACTELLDSPASQRREIGQQARLRIERHFHPDRETEVLTQFLSELIPSFSS